MFPTFAPNLKFNIKMSNNPEMNDPKLEFIMEKTLELFFEFGIKNLNMDEISRNLGISKKTLYKFVKNKEDLIYKFFRYHENKLEIEDAELEAQNYNAIDVVLFASLRVFENMGKFNPMLKFELQKYYEPIFNKFLNDKRNQIFNKIIKNINQGINEGLYRDNLNVELVAGLYVSTLFDMHNKEYCFTENTNFVEIFEIMVENHIRAIASQKGLEYFEKRINEIELIKNIKNNLK